MRFFAAALSIAVLLTSAAATGQLNWPTYGFTYDNTRYVGIEQINRSNVSRLSPVWRFVIGGHEHVETTPLVIGRTMYLTEGLGDNVIALDAATGKMKWRYRPAIGFMSACCGAINRGVAIEGQRVFVATIDAQLIALDAATGKPVWRTRIGNPAQGLSETMAPLAWNGVVYIGSSGSDFGLRGSFSAYRAADGKLLWRWYAVSRGWEGSYVQSVNGFSLHRDIAREKRDAAKYSNSWEHGGGAVWMTPALETSSGTIYLSTTNPWPVENGHVRPGDNLYTDSIVALNARTGKQLWFYQEVPHDVWEYEPSSPPVLFDVADAHSHRIPAVGEAGKNRWFYILSRTNGTLLHVVPFSPHIGTYDPPNPQAQEMPLRGTLGTISYSPAAHLAFVTAIDRPEYHSGAISGPSYWRDFIAAIDVNAGRISWQRMLDGPHSGLFGDHMVPGSVSTRQLVFVADPDGNLFALDALSGKVLWQYQLGTGPDLDVDASAFTRFTHHVRDWLEPIKRTVFHQESLTQATASVFGSPMIYQVDGREYLLIGFDVAPDSATGGAEICVFALPDQ